MEVQLDGDTVLFGKHELTFPGNIVPQTYKAVVTLLRWGQYITPVPWYPLFDCKVSQLGSDKSKTTKSYRLDGKTILTPGIWGEGVVAYLKILSQLMSEDSEVT
jgi:hypothetical protein